MKKINKKVLIVGAVVIALVAGGVVSTQAQNRGNTKTASQQQTASTVAPALATVEVNKTFEFGVPVEILRTNQKIAYTVVTAERKDEIKIKGTATKAGGGKVYLILRLEINNPTTTRIQFMSADFIRMETADGKKFSPDYHNGAVTLDPISIKKDLVAFKVDEDQKNFKFQVGELDKEKQTVEIVFE